MKRTSWILGAISACALAACGGGNAGDDAETGSPEMTADTASPPMDTTMADTAAAGGMGGATDTTTH